MDESILIEPRDKDFSIKFNIDKGTVNNTIVYIDFNDILIICETGAR